MWQQLFQQLQSGDARALARSISLIENEVPGAGELLQMLQPAKNSTLIGITGPPGAGKSTLVDGLIGQYIARGARVAVLCVDPSSPFHHGALLGDRIRMRDWYTHPSVFIRSLASRGAMGGLHPKIIELSDLLRSAGFDYVLVETVGVGQSEVEIAALADTTVVVLVPEAGDEVQTMKAGLMEIADIFVVNKSDRPDADAFVHHLRQMLAPAFQRRRDEVPVLKTVAHEGKGLEELAIALDKAVAHADPERRSSLLTERAWQLVQQYRMKDIRRDEMEAAVIAALAAGDFNLYRFAAAYSR